MKVFISLERVSNFLNNHILETKYFTYISGYLKSVRLKNNDYNRNEIKRMERGENKYFEGN